MFKFSVWLVFLSSIIPLSACSDRSGGHSRGDKPQPVISAAVVWQHESTQVEAVGTSRARHSVTLFPAVSGEVVAVNFKTGQEVKQNDVLLQLDDRDEKLAVDIAKVQLSDARRLLDRYTRTRGSGAVTASTLDDARSGVERARINLDRAIVALDHHSIEAPFTGHMGLSTLDPGARVNTTTEIATIDDRGVLLVTFELPEILLGQLAVEQEIVLQTWANDRSETIGKVMDIGSRVDPRTRTFTVRAYVDNANDNLRPGMSFRIVLSLQGGRYPVVPEAALQWGGDGAYVWAVQDGKVSRVAATIVQRINGQILLDAQLPEGILVVVEGVQRMREGQVVQDVTETAL